MEKRKRNTSELGIGAAADRIIKLRRERASDIEEATRAFVAGLEKRYADAEASILARVPELQRGLVQAMVAAALPVAETLDLTGDDDEERSAVVIVEHEPGGNGNGRFSEHDDEPDPQPDDELDMVACPPALQREWEPKHIKAKL